MLTPPTRATPTAQQQAAVLAAVGGVAGVCVCLGGDPWCEASRLTDVHALFAWRVFSSARAHPCACLCTCFV